MTANAHKRTFRLAIQVPDNGHSLSANFPFLHVQHAISKKSDREQIWTGDMPDGSRRDRPRLSHYGYVFVKVLGAMKVR
jgi:hypothetical protein